MKIGIEKYPEEKTEDGLLIYSETSMDNCLAVLTHYAHNYETADEETRQDIVRLAEDWLEAKQVKDKSLKYVHEEIKCCLVIRQLQGKWYNNLQG